MFQVFLYLGIMLGVILIWFLLFKRPIYEAIFVSFLVLLTVTSKWGAIGGYFVSALNTPLLYSMVVFVAMSVMLTKTNVVDGAVEIIMSVLGRIPGGPGYVSLLASSFMGALSGSGPGNVMATGVITIPAMKKAGFPPELAANVESACSYMGNMIPPSSNIVAALGAFLALYPETNLSIGQFWFVCWGCSIWMIIQRGITIFAFAKYYKIRPLTKDEVPKFKDTIKNGWQGLFLPVIILVPFLLDYIWNATFFTQQLGPDGAKALSSSVLYFVAGIAAIYAVIVAKDRKKVTFTALADMFGNSIKSISPPIGTCLFGYMIGALFADLELDAGLQASLASLEMGKLGICVLIPLITCFLGMVIPGSSLVVMFGSVFITLFASVGVDPLLAAAMLPCICGVMCGITPPLALGMYAGMSIAESEFGKTVKNDLWWVALEFIMEVVLLMGFLPVLGL